MDTGGWLSGPPAGPPFLTGGSGGKIKELEPGAIGRAGLSAHPHPNTLTSKGSTSTEVLKSLSSGCSMFPLRKKNLQPGRPVSCCRVGHYPGTLPSSKNARWCSVWPGATKGSHWAVRDNQGLTQMMAIGNVTELLWALPDSLYKVATINECPILQIKKLRHSEVE